MKPIYKVKFIDDGDDRTMEAALRGILAAQENLRPKVEGVGMPVVQGPLRRVILPETPLTAEGVDDTMEAPGIPDTGEDKVEKAE